MPDVNYVSQAVQNNSIVLADSDDRNPTSMHTQRSKLRRMESYDAAGNSVYSEANHYDTDKELLTNPSLESNQRYCYVGKTIVDDYPLQATCKVYYQGADSLVFETIYAYNQRGQVFRTEVPDGNGNTIISQIQYIADVPEPNTLHQRMIDRNMFSYPYKKQVSKSENVSTPGLHSPMYLVSGERYNYYDFNLHFRNTQFPLTSISSTNLPGQVMTPAEFAFDDYLVEGTTCQYSRDGNLIQTTDRNGVSTTYVWGHGGVFLLAKVIGAAHQQVGAISGLDRLDEYTRSGNLTQAQIDALYALSNTQVSVYEYDPFVGLTRAIDPAQREMYYTYDADGKLSGIADDKGQPTTQYEYHISNQ